MSLESKAASKPTLRRLVADDVEPYRAIMLHAYEHAADAFTSTPQERAAESLSWWTARVADASGSTVSFGAFVDGTLAGVVALEYSAKTKTQHKALVIGMYVLPTQRGRGLARALLEAALAHARARPGLRLLQLEVTQGNAPAQALYESLGFRAYGIEPMAVLTPRGFRSKVHMWLPLDPGEGGT